MLQRTDMQPVEKENRANVQESHLRSAAVRKNQLFVSRWLRNPREVGAVTPSGQQLAYAMASQVNPAAGLVVELGAGTGVITAALLKHGVLSQQLVVIETCAAMARDLALLFPAVTVLRADAARLSGLLTMSDCNTPGTVVSSLPLLSLHTRQRFRILKEIASVLPVGGRLIQFTYSPFPPISVMLARRLGFEGSRVRRIAINLPPAAVWVYEKQSPTSA
jgi:phosphatidylethanolamine/phosphatidyl-N-methylethanolamine N-methyltransferase